MIMYMVIFMLITILIQTAFTSSKSTSTFAATSLNIAVIDRDGGMLAKGLLSYLDAKHKLVDVPDNKKDMQEALFYRNVEYIVIIPKNFEEQFLGNKEAIKTTKVPGSFTGLYVDQQINTFLNSIRVYTAGGYSITKAINSTMEQGKLEANVTVIDRNGNGGEITVYTYMFQYMPYLFIGVLCFAMSLVMVMFRNKEIKRRMLCSSVSIGRQNGQAIAAFLVVGIGFWMIAMMLPIIMYGKEFLTSVNLKYYLLNSFIFMLVALSMSFLVGIIAKNSNVINNIVNVLALGLCFLGGVFVPLSMLGNGVKKVAQFLPTYWYEQVNGIIGEYGELSEELLKSIYKGMGIQIIFAIACVCVGLAVSKLQEQEKN
ncbi:MAG: ABC transporter permease, partial [Lachnospiraceae bacterium]|nr:ABC transporter permease [Lachnospiraceae bacterium]